MGTIKVTEHLLRQLEAQGYQVKRKRNLERKTFVVDRDILEAFLKAREKAGVKLQDAVSEALKDWTDKKR